MKAAQLGFTEGAVNWLGYVIHHAPAPFLFVQPTVDLAKRLSRQRLEPAIVESPVLRSRVGSARRGETGNTVLLKEFPGGLVALTGANSAAGLCAISARDLALDEIDRFPGNVEDEGDPIGLVEARSRTFGARRKELLMSTPTIAGTSRIEREFLATDQRRYFVPCPTCDSFQVLEFKQLDWEPGKPHTVRYRCTACGARIREAAKTKMLARGEWRATALRAPDPAVAGFHLNALYSPVGWLSWADIAEAAEKASRDPQLQQTFENTILAEPYAQRGDAPDWQRLRERQTAEPLGRVPPGVLFLTMGVDVQRDRLECSLWGWGRERRSWLVDHLVLEGDIATETPWTALTALVARTWPTPGELGMPLARVAVDTGFATTQAHAWARKQPAGRVLLVRGGGTGPALVSLPRATEATEAQRRRRRQRGLRVWQVNVHAIQIETYGWLHMDAAPPGQPPPAGWISLPAVGDEFLRQLCAKALVRKVHKGVERQEWVNVYRRDEATDCRNYARAAAHVVGLDRFEEADWRRLEAPLGVVPAAPASKPVDAPPAPPTVPLPDAAAPAATWRRSTYWRPRPRR